MAAILELNLMSILRLGSGACGLWGNREAGETMGDGFARPDRKVDNPTGSIIASNLVRCNKVAGLLHCLRLIVAGDAVRFVGVACFCLLKRGHSGGLSRHAHPKMPDGTQNGKISAHNRLQLSESCALIKRDNFII